MSPISTNVVKGEVLDSREKSVLVPAMTQEFKQDMSLTPDSMKEDILKVDRKTNGDGSGL